MANEYLKKFASNAATPMATQGQQDTWSAVGKPLKGFGGARYRMDLDFLYCEKGMVRTEGEQLRSAFITDISLKQSVTQKARGIGSLKVEATQPDGRKEIMMVEDIPDPAEARRIIIETANNARNRERIRENTRTFVGDSVSTPSSRQADNKDDVVQQLRTLAELRDTGVITSEDFEAKKAELLKRM